jgi:hypothetical protein
MQRQDAPGYGLTHPRNGGFLDKTVLLTPEHDVDCDSVAHNAFPALPCAEYKRAPRSSFTMPPGGVAKVVSVIFGLEKSSASV